MIRYRAILYDAANTTAQRASQIFGNDLATAEAWAKEVLAKAVGTHAHVDIYEQIEKLVKQIDREVK